MLQEAYELALELSNKSLSNTKSAHGIGQKAEILYKLERVSEALKVANDGYQWEIDHRMDGQYFKKMIGRFKE
ncbi:hypothetical protein [Marinoscillum pacificum]|uniref:hypothetical protein n=1 Tax=Marinoscillum pacificum TaxID=392723 RepID=UPI002157FE95|nr:hypothetical protein [Marinoscillum pacificum]